MAQHTKNNHYIPRVLIRRFSNESGERFYCENGIIRKRDAKKIFSAMEIYSDELEEKFGLNESKLKGVFDKIDEDLRVKPCVLSREITIPEWSIKIYNTIDDAETVNVLNTFFFRMNLKFNAASTNKDSKEIDVARRICTASSFEGSDTIVLIKYNFNFCPFILPVSIPVILPIGMSLVFATPISKDTIMVHYCNRSILDSFLEKYRYKHQLNLAMLHLNTPNGRILSNFVCSNKEYASRIIGGNP